MRIPLWLVMFLPKSIQDKSMQGRWDDKTDEEIIHAYKYNWDSSRLWNNMSKPHSRVVRNAIKNGKYRSEVLIGPQMKRRGLTVDPPKSKYGYIHGKEI